MTRYFISGHIDLSQEEFDTFYKDKIIEAAKDDKSSFIMGSAPGADYMAQELLLNIFKDTPENINRITVVHRGDSPEKIADNRIQTIGGFKSHDQKDAFMTHNSDIDIAYVRSAEESKKLYGEKYNPTRISGTQKNLNRRKNLIK